MRKYLLFSVLGLFAGVTNAQTTLEDTVSIGNGYANQIWYQLETGNETVVSATDWDIAFKSFLMSATIFVNDEHTLWKYPGTIADWASLDTTGMADNWDVCINSRFNWDEGAFNHTTSTDTLDYGWGAYSPVTHTLEGVAIFVIRLKSGDFKKIIIEGHSTSGVYTFKYANLDGSNEVTETLEKSNFNTKNFAYYSLTAEQELDPEPESDNWDLYFTRYTEMINMGGGEVPYPVTGVLMNEGVTAVKVENVDQASYEAYESHTLVPEKNTIGYDWKSYDMTNGVYVVDDSTVFFVEDKSGSFWKLVFTGFDNEEGSFILSKKMLESVGISDKQTLIASLATYPNPVRSDQFTVLYSLHKTSAQPALHIYDFTGRLVKQQNVVAQATGIQQIQISTAGWAKGVYVLNLEVEGQTATHKIVIQ